MKPHSGQSFKQFELAAYQQVHPAALPQRTHTTWVLDLTSNWGTDTQVRVIPSVSCDTSWVSWSSRKSHRTLWMDGFSCTRLQRIWRISAMCQRFADKANLAKEINRGVAVRPRKCQHCHQIPKWYPAAGSKLVFFLVYSRPLLIFDHFYIAVRELRTSMTPRRQDEHKDNSFVQLASPALVTLSTTNVLSICGCERPLCYPVTQLSPWQCSVGGNHRRRNTHENGHQVAGVFVSLVIFAIAHWTTATHFWRSPFGRTSTTRFRSWKIAKLAGIPTNWTASSNATNNSIDDDSDRLNIRIAWIRYLYNSIWSKWSILALLHVWCLWGQSHIGYI